MHFSTLPAHDYPQGLVDNLHFAFVRVLLEVLRFKSMVSHGLIMVGAAD